MFSVPSSGRYPNFLWLYKEILPELRRQFSFHAQLVAQVERWRREIRAQLAGEVVFVGVHCRIELETNLCNDFCVSDRLTPV